MIKALCPFAAALALLATAHAQTVLFEDDFESDTAADWSVFDGFGVGPSDFGAQFNFDYSTVPYTFEVAPDTFVTNTIPAAPNSAGGATRGVRLAVNKNDAVADTAGLSVYPKNQTFSGNYALRADVWINYNGGSYGGTGSTEFATFGINHQGTVVNWIDLQPVGDGSWFAVAGEAGAARDYRAYEFDGSQSVELLSFDGGLIGADHGEAVFQDRFPAPRFESPGAPGKRWVQVEVAQRSGQIVWKIDGFVIAERPNLAPANSGTVMLGTMDLFSSIADPGAENYVLVDNVRVVNLDTEPEPSTVRVEISDATAAEPADTGVFTLRRVGGNQTQPLTVTYRLAGTATPGVDYETNALDGFTATIAAGADTADVVITPINDSRGESAETVVLILTGNPAYEMRDAVSGTIDLADDGDTSLVSIAATDLYSYERLAEDTATLTVSRSGDTSTDLTVQLQLGGTASNGTDLETLPTTVTLAAGTESVPLVVVPKDDTVAEGDETVVVTLQPGAGYVLGATTNATATLLDDDYPDAPVLFTDALDAAGGSAWQIRFGAANGIDDYRAEFGYDYSADLIPPAPSSGGTTQGLKVTVNKDEASASGAASCNVYLKELAFTGNYAVRFDLFLTYSSSVAGTTEHAIFGINHSGAVTNRHAAAGSDGAWFAIETDGSASSGRSYVSYLGVAGDVPAFTAKSAAVLAPYFTAPPYLAAGAAAGQWVDVEVRQLDGRITLRMNGATVFEGVDPGAWTGGTIMLGHMDTFNSIGAPENFSVFDNVRVVRLESTAIPQPTIGTLAVDAGNVLIAFTSPSGAPGDFAVASSATVDGSYAVEASTITSTGVGAFQATLPLNGTTRFYQIRR